MHAESNIFTSDKKNLYTVLCKVRVEYSFDVKVTVGLFWTGCDQKLGLLFLSIDLNSGGIFTMMHLKLFLNSCHLFKHTIFLITVIEIDSI